MNGRDAETGWAYLAERESIAAVIDALLRAEDGATYTTSELATEAGIPMKTLYLEDATSELVDIGLLEPVGDDAFAVRADSEVLDAAAAFGRALEAALE